MGDALVLSEGGLPEPVEALAAELLPPAATVRWRHGRRAAVLIAFHDAPRQTDDDLRLVFVEKNAQLRSHGGQVAFPGGSLESSDDGVVDAALREAYEEAWIAPGDVTPLGILPTDRTHVARSDFDVVPVVGWWTAPAAARRGDPGEIAAVHDVAVDGLLDPANRLTWAHPSGMTGPAFVIDDLFIWGFTAGLLDAMFDLAGWTVAWDRGHVTPIPPRFYHER